MSTRELIDKYVGIADEIKKARLKWTEIMDRILVATFAHIYGSKDAHPPSVNWTRVLASAKHATRDVTVWEDVTSDHAKERFHYLRRRLFIYPTNEERTNSWVKM